MCLHTSNQQYPLDPCLQTYQASVWMLDCLLLDLANYSSLVSWLILRLHPYLISRHRQLERVIQSPHGCCVTLGICFVQPNWLVYTFMFRSVCHVQKAMIWKSKRMSRPMILTCEMGLQSLHLIFQLWQELQWSSPWAMVDWGTTYRSQLNHRLPYRSCGETSISSFCLESLSTSSPDPSASSTC